MGNLLVRFQDPKHQKQLDSKNPNFYSKKIEDSYKGLTMSNWDNLTYFSTINYISRFLMNENLYFLLPFGFMCHVNIFIALKYEPPTSLEFSPKTSPSFL
jgi:hypothetical protein